MAAARGRVHVPAKAARGKRVGRRRQVKGWARGKTRGKVMDLGHRAQRAAARGGGGRWGTTRYWAAAKQRAVPTEVQDPPPTRSVPKQMLSPRKSHGIRHIAKSMERAEGQKRYLLHTIPWWCNESQPAWPPPRPASPHPTVDIFERPQTPPPPLTPPTTPPPPQGASASLPRTTSTAGRRRAPGWCRARRGGKGVDGGS